MDSAAVTIKGTKDGLIIVLGAGPLDGVLEEMDARLASKAGFFLGGRVALRVGDRALSEEQITLIGGRIASSGMTLWAVESHHPATHAAARGLGLETGLLPASAGLQVPLEQLPREELPGIVVRRTLRAGQELHHPGHVTLIGDVNPGAELVAGGDVIVWGRLRGKVHAGALGDDGACVCALQLAPSQIRIGSHIAQSPERGRLPKVPEMASVQDEGIVVERWDQR